MADDTLAACLAEIKANPGKFYIYVLSRPDGRPFYVGKGFGQRIRMHENDARYGRRGIRFSVIRNIWKVGDLVSYRVVSFHAGEAEAFVSEIALIAKIGRREHGGPLVNNTDGGEGAAGLVITPEMRAKLSAALTGKPKTPEHAAKVGAANRGKKRSPEFSVKMSAILKSPEVNARMISGRAGYKATDETRAKNSAAKLGTKHSEETKAKMSVAHLGQKRSPEAKANISAGALKRPPVSPEECEKRRQRALARPPMTDETKRILSEKATAIRAIKKWGVSEEQRQQISAKLLIYNAALRAKK